MTVHVVDPNLFGPTLAALRRQVDELRVAAEDEALRRWAERHRESVEAVAETAASIAPVVKLSARPSPPPEWPRNRAERRRGMRGRRR